MSVSAVVPYFGAKRTLAQRIVAEIGPHRAYFEPMCGSCAVLMSKPIASMECVNDLNGDLTNLLRVVADEELSLMLFSRTRRMLMSEAMFREAAERWKKRGRKPAPETPDLEAAVDYLYTSWVGRNGTVGTKSYNQGFAARYTQNGGHAGARWMSAVESIPEWHDRLRSVVVLNRDGFQLIERIEDQEGTVIYLDPPYVEKGAEYIHDFESDDHRRLADLVKRFKNARVIVSYYEHPLLDELYAGWTFVRCPVNKAMCRGITGAVEAPEVLIINGESVTGGSLFAGAAS